MAEFKPSQKTKADFNNNTQYRDYDPSTGQNGDAVQASTINNLVESQLWTQALATNAPDTSAANVVGTPSVEIATASDGTPKLKFKNLKGESVKVASISTSSADSGNNVVTFSDGSILNVKNGSKGSTGATGSKGDKGAKGDTGVGISSIAYGSTLYEDDYSYTPVIFTKTDNTTNTVTIAVKNGETGLTGLQFNTIYQVDYNEDLFDEPPYIPLTYFNRQPLVGEEFIMFYSIKEEDNKVFATTFIVENASVVHNGVECALCNHYYGGDVPAIYQITGNDGRGISKITDYYAVSTSNTAIPTSWSTTVPTMTSTNKYLWNYQYITYTDGDVYRSAERVIGVYGDKGDTGDAGTVDTSKFVTIDSYQHISGMKAFDNDIFVTTKKCLYVGDNGQTTTIAENFVKVEDIVETERFKMGVGRFTYSYGDEGEENYVENTYLIPSESGRLATEEYVGGEITAIETALTNYPKLTSSNAYTGNNYFTNGIYVGFPATSTTSAKNGVVNFYGNSATNVLQLTADAASISGVTNLKLPTENGTLATQTFVNEKVANLVNSAPEALDTLQELATALGNDANFATTVSTQLGNKVDKVSGKQLSTNDYTTAEKTKLAGIAEGANKYTLPTASSSTLGGVKTTSTVTSASGYTACPIISGVPYYKDTNTTYTFSANAPTLAWGTTSTIGTAGGTTYTVTMPANPNTDTGATSVAVSGSGNAVTAASYDASTGKLTLTKGTTFLTSHQDISGKLSLSGGTMTGNLKWSSTTALPEITSPKYLLAIDAFADGGTTKWASIANVKTALGVPTTYAGSSSAGGSATSAVKLDTATAGSATQPVYFSGGKPVATTYTLGASVPSGAKFTDTTYSVATTSANGLMSASDKSKLDNLSGGNTSRVSFTSGVTATLFAAYEYGIYTYDGFCENCSSISFRVASTVAKTIAVTTTGRTPLFMRITRLSAYVTIVVYVNDIMTTATYPITSSQAFSVVFYEDESSADIQGIQTKIITG